ncbi:MAG TPA: hypothetical protein VLJ58_15885 [Ramlibacter sp.]|nr:hypothetical protein [Ramlibacter sp.]
MNWTPLPKGCFTGIDWEPRDATRGYDPYLVWADCDGFSGYGGHVPVWLPIMIELQPACTIAQLIAAASPDWLRVPNVYTSCAAPAGLSFCTARVKRQFFQAIQPGGALHALVKRFELGLPASDSQAAAVSPGAKQGACPQHSLVPGKVFALIDDSLALAHANFLQPDGNPRTAYFWRQDGRGKGSVPAGLGYGHELTAADIASAMDRNVRSGLVDESAVYVDLGLSELGKLWPQGTVEFHALDTAVSHGSHVADLGVGPRTVDAQTANLPPGFDAPPSWAMAGDVASRCPLVAVQLDYQTVKDTSGGSLNVHVLDGLLYILSRCEADAQVAVNISFGTLAGPHDGTSLLEAAMDQLLALTGGRMQIVLAAGNSYQLRTHANLPLAAGAEEALHWRVQPDDTTQSFLELWIEKGCDQLEIQLTPPGGTALPVRKIGDSGLWLDAAGKPVCALIYPSRVATGERGTCVLLALAPTFSFAATDATAPSGVWKIQLANRSSRSVVVDGYIERDDVVIGARSGARQSRFDDKPTLAWDQQYDMQAYIDDPDRKTPIRRSGNFNSIATGSKTVSAGGRRITDDSWAHYSPRSPDPDASRPCRPGVVKIPSAWACSDENAALTGLKAAGTRSSAQVRLEGTSDAAPQVTRGRLDAM